MVRGTQHSTALPNLYDPICDDSLTLALFTMSESASNLYARLLLTKKHGYPLYRPEPLANLSIEYQERGISVGDVGFVKYDGSFRYLFNICEPAGSAVNCNPDGLSIVPEDFEQLPLQWGDVDTQPHYHVPGSILISHSILKAGIRGDLLVTPNP